MKPDRWRRIKELCHEAAARDAAGRAAFLDESCGDDAELRREVESLLAKASEAEGFLATPAWRPPVLAPGTRLGPHEILGLIGAGGMGEVYRARDTKLGRDVALKTLPERFASDPERLARFEREARVLASLNHPNIAQIHGLQEADGVKALLLELVEGPTLADRIATGPIALDEALAIAKQIAEALEAAHERDIIHRDLKPANIKVRDDGTVKVLDFGLAKVLGFEASEVELANSPTTASPATAVGVILGTAAYMSPEQAKGLPIDKRADIWAFGCVLYEMLTGRRAFDSPSVTDTLAAIVLRDPDWSALSAETPGRVRDLLRRCLTKDQKQRLRDIGDARLEIEEARHALGHEETAAGAGPTSAPRGLVSRWLPWALAATSLATALVLLLGGRQTPAEDVVQLNIALPDSAPLVFVGEGTLGLRQTALALSRDGRHLAYVGPAGDTTRLYVRDLRTAETRALARTEGAYGPFFSPDGQWIAFFSGQQLKRASVDGERVLPVAEANVTIGGSWGRDDRIAVVASDASRIGIATPTSGHLSFVELDGTWNGGVAHPQWLPGGEWLLLLCYLPHHVCAVSVRTGEFRHLVTSGEAVAGNDREAEWLAGGNPRFVEPDLLVYSARGNNVVMGVRFDPTRLAVTGTPVPLLSGIRREDSHGALQLATTVGGDLVYARGVNRGVATFGWVDRNNNIEPLPFRPRPYGLFKLSPDGRFIATQVLPAVGPMEIWFLDLRRPDQGRRWTPSILPSYIELFPTAWEPDSQSVLLYAERPGAHYVIRADALRAGGGEILWSGTAPLRVWDVGPGGRMLAVLDPRFSNQGLALLNMTDLANLPADPAAALEYVAKGPGALASLSPDLEWLTYTWPAWGSYEVFGQRLTAAEPPVQISNGGGFEPRWAPDGSGVWFRNGQRFYWVARTRSSDEPFATPEFVLKGDFLQVVGPGYAVSPDGQRILVQLGQGEERTSALDVILNWRADVERRLRDADRSR